MKKLALYVGGIFVALLLGLALVVFATGREQLDWEVSEVVRTPDARFANLVDYPFAPHYEDVLGYRIHYVDEGPRDGQVILLLHGQPSWSYLYRHMIPPLVEAGFRVIAPDLVGFGKSDKPTDSNAHSYQMHIDVMGQFVAELDLQAATLFAQDWGGLIGLRVVASAPERFARVMITNTGLPAASGVQGWLGYPLFKFAVWREGEVNDLGGAGGGASFTRWVAYALTAGDFDFHGLFQRATHRSLSSEELAGYAAPFPDQTYQAAVRVFPYLVPSQLRSNARVMEDVFEHWDKPFLTAFGDADPVTAGGEQVWINRVPGAAQQDHARIEDGAHFIQEDQPQELVQRLIRFVNAR